MRAGDLHLIGRKQHFEALERFVEQPVECRLDDFHVHPSDLGVVEQRLDEEVHAP